MVNHMLGFFSAIFAYLFFATIKSSTVKRVMGVIKQVDKSNLANFDVTMLYAIFAVQNKGITLIFPWNIKHKCTTG